MTVKRIGHRYIDAASGKTLDVWFPRANTQIARSCLAQKVGVINSDFVEVELEIDGAPQNIEDAYLRLHLLSEGAVTPNNINLEGIFGLLTNIAWTSAGPVLPTKVDELRAAIASEHHHLTISSIDKFPRMTDYVIPEGVRIGDADRVRLGAHLASGSTVMHEGFVNFNAGTLGSSMVEGRISQGVVVGDGSDIGGGASTMGTLSGGGKTINAIGKNSMVGANAGIGISLGDDCIVEAGLYVTAGTKVTTPDGEVVAARELSGMNGLLFRRNSQNGAVEAIVADSSKWGGLNASLHSND
ncbi:DapH/DapD/GlmU-related protein [Paraglaciecola chathamensis]|uniref:2,3,4,5-tetrahydropyridine-2,6-dicarboxylate N-succinyltransferase n=1 Tax=Paraglaciecola chathamensis TaxID=368405 RepID=A0A8H9I953_9ALTE|nr:DapH/DapD/GlmU-related protein [Paraglaciecola oceanifecundans]GGZ47276.1 2,3,4,5-tetrahydropyridine-2,6-dicarboxylate N-succinyltransferase [Paraglaciecola oceanifecundans]